ncbi:MAG: pyruvate formate lyase family protein [Eubacteriales bacterium]
MTERIRRLTERTLAGDMYVKPVAVEFDRTDLFLDESARDIKHLCEYILAQEPKLTPDSAFTGFFNFNGSVVGDAFHRGGHRHTGACVSLFYLKPVDNLSTMEWQHATADYRKVLKKGLSGIRDEIAASLAVHTAPDETAFLSGLVQVADTLTAWAHRCADRIKAFIETLDEAEAKARLSKLADALTRVPEYAPQSFYEAVLCIYICFSADPDSFGTLDRYLTDFYRADIAAGRLTRQEAAEYLQELFLMVQAATPASSKMFTRGGESHFCIGGYLPDGTDGFNEVSRLIAESLTALPTYIPQITLRWTQKLSRDDFRYMMDLERNDPHKRIAFTNDEKRIRCYTEICGFPFERAVNYTTAGCNEPAFLGAITGSNSKGNLLRCVERLFHEQPACIADAPDFDAFYAEFERVMYADLDVIYDYDDKYNACRARDINYISSLFFNDCIENARSLTQGGGDVVVSSPMLLGIPNVIDALIAVRQFVFDEGLLTMRELIDILHNDWVGYEDMRNLILSKGVFFGNDDDRSNQIAARLYDSLYRYLRNKRNLFGYPILVGDLVGYNEHHLWFGEKTLATPDGRHAGDRIKFGLGQSEGRDKNGLSALLNSIAQTDPHAIACGSTVTNISIDEQLIRDDGNFEKTVDLFETYFRNGGVHFQLTYVSREDLLHAKVTPDEYKNLRVRVTGFSDYFTRLQESMQDDIIERTQH